MRSRKGAVVVVAAGNRRPTPRTSRPRTAAASSPSARTARSGDRSSYSNFGKRIDISAPGGDFPGDSNLIVSTSNDGTTTPGQPGYAHAAGTSFAAPLVSGTASLMLARNALLTPGHVLDDHAGHCAQLSRRHARAASAPAAAAHARRGRWRSASTFAATSTPPPERRPGRRVSIAPTSITTSSRRSRRRLRTSTRTSAAIFKRTGFIFYAYLACVPGAARRAAGMPLLRAPGVDQLALLHARTRTSAPYVQSHWPGIWNLETPAAFYIQVPDSTATARRTRCRCIASSTTGAMRIIATRWTCRFAAR